MALKISHGVAGLNGNQDVVLVGKSPLLNYENGKPKSSVPIGVKYQVALPGNRLTTITVKIEGAYQCPQLTYEDIQEATSQGDYIYVNFLGSVCNMYTISGEQRISATAKSLSLLVL